MIVNLIEMNQDQDAVEMEQEIEIIVTYMRTMKIQIMFQGKRPPLKSNGNKISALN
jgi:hypothetical protein